jgi:DNA-binding protein HU-beta
MKRRDVIMAKFEGVVVNKEELVKRVAEKVQKTKKETGEVVEALFEVIGEALEKGEKIDVRSTLTLEPVDVEAKTYRNPRTGEEVQKPATKRVKAKAGSKLQKRVKG